MAHLTRFILNDQEIATEASPSMTLLDFIRVDNKLTGTTTACREGDCGACTVLLGELRNGVVHYRNITSCLLPLGDAEGLHVVSIEGLNQAELNPVQQAMVDNGGTQCGFCTPGFVVSMTRYFLRSETLCESDGIAAIDGNICRCTGYKSIQRAIGCLSKKFAAEIPVEEDRIKALVARKIVPPYFLEIPARLAALQAKIPDSPAPSSKAVLVGGGTDLYVQRPEAMLESEIDFVFKRKELKGITFEGGRCSIGAATTMEDMNTNKRLREIFPKLGDYFHLIASTPIREQAAVGGNLINASPIGDLTIFFLALNAEITLNNGGARRTLLLKNFYKGYKSIDRTPGEILERISFSIPDKGAFYNFEKVSKRINLDIASVNSALQMTIKDGKIASAHASAGGVAPIPLFLAKTAAYLCGKEVSITTVREAAKLAQEETAPISDARGSAEYKRLLLRQLIYAHFCTCFPEKISLRELR